VTGEARVEVLIRRIAESVTLNRKAFFSGAGAAQRLAFERDAVGAMMKPIQDGVCDGRLAEHGREPPKSNE
jgi:hypothetical protein